MPFRLFKLQQSVEDIIVNDADLCPDPDANDDADLFNKIISSQEITEVGNQYPQRHLRDRERKEQTVKINDNEIRSI